MVDLEAELDELLRDAGWAGMSWKALSTKYAKSAATDELKTALDRFPFGLRQSRYRGTRLQKHGAPHDRGRLHHRRDSDRGGWRHHCWRDRMRSTLARETPTSPCDGSHVFGGAGVTPSVQSACRCDPVHTDGHRARGK